MHLIGKQNFVSSTNSSSSTTIFYPLPNTIIDILKQFKNCYFEEYERKIKEEEEREEIERQKRLGKKIAIKMVNNNNNSSSTTTSTGAATNIGISRGSSISSDGQSQPPTTPLKTKIQNILTSSSTTLAHQQPQQKQQQII
uniref:Uncharacterized protein n=1 Tax=Meloidogyne enterolobii TaxID=390850 RepID=A0A6V7UWX9_MELEN|nr:unnamed protein product [Meloidogyne enterolobii]